MREHHWAKHRRQGEDDVEIGGVEKTALTLGDPTVLGGALAGRTVAIEAGVVQRHLTATVLAGIEVPSERSGAAALEVAQDPIRFVGQGVFFPIFGGKAVKDLRHLELGTRLRVLVHLRWLFCLPIGLGPGGELRVDFAGDGIQGGARLGNHTRAHMNVTHGAVDAGVTEQGLDDAQIGTGL